MSDANHYTSLHELEALFPPDPLHELADESAARHKQQKDAMKHLASWLRAAADHVESGQWPMVMGCTVPRAPEYTVNLKGSLMSTVSVTFSHPWGG